MFRLAAGDAISPTSSPSPRLNQGKCSDVPDRQNATSLGEVGLLLDATDALLEDGRDLGRCGLLGICASLYRDGRGSGANLWARRGMLVSSIVNRRVVRCGAAVQWSACCPSPILGDPMTNPDPTETSSSSAKRENLARRRELKQALARQPRDMLELN